MRVGEVLDWQKRVRAAGAPATAAGGYQVIYKTLRRLVTRHGIALDARFTPALQDRLARHLINECGPKGPRARHPRYGNCLAGIWAALPLTSGPGKGRSAYYNLAGNRALTSPETLLALLAGQPRAAWTCAAARGQAQGWCQLCSDRDSAAHNVQRYFRGDARRRARRHPYPLRTHMESGSLCPAMTP